MMRAPVSYLLFTLASLAMAVAPAAEPLPGDSVYQLDVQLTDQDGEKLAWSELRGRPVVVSMFYASCPHVCPMLINTMQRTERELSEELREDVRVVMISLDPERDDPEALSGVANRYSVDRDRWRLVRPEPEAVRSIAAALGIRYRKLPDGEFNHTTALILLDADGVPVTVSSTVPKVDPAFVEALETHFRAD